MASITQNKKDGKVISYKFKACIGRDEFGKQIFRCTTWKVPDGLAAARVEKAAQKAATEWEQQAKEEYRRDVENPESLLALLMFISPRNDNTNLIIMEKYRNDP